MGSNDAIKGMVSQSLPIGKINPIYITADYKKQQALLNSKELAQGIYESVDDYYKRRAEFLAEHNKKIQAENTQVAEKKYNGITNLNIWNTNDLSKLQNAQNQLSSLFRFTQFNKLDPTFDNQIYLAKKLQTQTDERIAQIKKSGEAQTGDKITYGYNNNSNYAAIDFQNSGERDIIA